MQTITQTGREVLVRMTDVDKSFPGVRALDHARLELRAGEVHALVGENGAGKSTLMKILNGIYVTYGGDMTIGGERVRFDSPQDAFDKGVAIIHQELDMVGNLSVAENIFLGREILRGRKIDRKAMRAEAQAILDRLGFPIDAGDLVEKLPIARQQLVMIARVVSMNARVVVMDEPTSSLSHNDTENLFRVIGNLRADGISVIYISHFLEEVFRVADRVTVLRDGRKVITADAAGCTQKDLVEWMVGKSHHVGGEPKYRSAAVGNVVLEVDGLTRRDGFVRNASLHIREGEVVGLAGVAGSGRSELARMIFGADRAVRGGIRLQGTGVKIDSPVRAVQNRIAFVPENRKTEGLVLIRSVFDNLSLPALRQSTRRGLLDHKKLRQSSARMVRDLNIKCASKEQEAKFLSGGNQQKIVIGKWLEVAPQVLILDQPTRGVDIGAKGEIYELINTLADRRCAILLISDELEELRNLADRILVMRKGEIIHEYDNGRRNVGKADLLERMVG